MVITLKQLKRAGACREKLAKFKNLFGDQARLTRKNLEKALANGFSYIDINFLMLSSAVTVDEYKWRNIAQSKTDRDTNSLDQYFLDAICEYYNLK